MNIVTQIDRIEKTTSSKMNSSKPLIVDTHTLAQRK